MDNKTASSVLQKSGFIGRMDYLASRWKDEVQYEGFEDYKTSIKKSAPAAFKVKRISSKPFSVTLVDTDNATHKVTVTGERIDITTTTRSPK